MSDFARPNDRLIGDIQTRLIRQEGAQAHLSNYSIQTEVFQKGSQLNVPFQKAVRLERPTILAFADDAPLLNWAHPCRYLLHDAETGECYQQIEAQFPLYPNDKDKPRSYQAFHQPVRFMDSDIYRIRPDFAIRPQRWKGKRYAVLFAGMSNNRHTNDLEFLYRTLRDVYQVPKSHIYVLNHDGTVNYDGTPKPIVEWPGDETAYRIPVHGQGSKSDLLGVLDELKGLLKSDDSLLIHTNNHGGHDGTESTLCSYPNWDSLGVKEFTDKLAELPSVRCLMLMMEQCHAGGFNNAVISKSTAQRTSIASACGEFASSIGGAEFDPFAHDWISAMAGGTAYGHSLQYDPDVNNNGQVTAKEAYNYANAVKDPYDTPVFNSIHQGAGCSLGQDLLVLKIPQLIPIELIRKHWPEPDPLKFSQRIEAILPEIEAINNRFEPQQAQLHQEYIKQVESILSKAAGKVPAGVR